MLIEKHYPPIRSRAWRRRDHGPASPNSGFWDAASQQRTFHRETPPIAAVFPGMAFDWLECPAMFQLRFAVRSLLKTPIVTVVAVLSVGFGIGSNVAIFSVFNQILLRPLPVPDPTRLVNLVSPGPRSGWSCGRLGTCDSVFSYPMFRDLQRVETAFVGIAAHRWFWRQHRLRRRTEGGDAALVSAPILRCSDSRLTRPAILPVDEPGTGGWRRAQRSILAAAIWCGPRSYGQDRSSSMVSR